MGDGVKRIICCLDGTWNNAATSGHPTNVYKLAEVLRDEDDSGIRQVRHYVVGIATDEGDDDQFLEGAIGLGVDDRIRLAYGLIAQDYVPGDEIYIFGFSRGAFEARSLAGFIDLLGLPRHYRPDRLDAMWELYRKGVGNRPVADLELFRSAAHYPVPIRCVGVWDTVGNIGNPLFADNLSRRFFGFHDLRLHDSIEVALHALSIDEVRGPFRPTFWTLPRGRPPRPGQHVEQVWFSGCHNDVGGGYRETALSDICLRWMAERAEALTGLAFDRARLARETRPDALGLQHSEAAGRLYTMSRRFPFVRLIRQISAGLPRLRRMIFGTFRSTRVPRGQVVVNEDIHESVRVRFGAGVEELRDGRKRRLRYRPRNLAAAMRAEVRAARRRGKG